MAVTSERSDWIQPSHCWRSRPGCSTTSSTRQDRQPAYSTRPSRCAARSTVRARTDSSLKGWKTALREAGDDETAKQAVLAKMQAIIKNTYKVLLSRGRKGCFVWCADPALREYLRERLHLASRSMSWRSDSALSAVTGRHHATNARQIVFRGIGFRRRSMLRHLCVETARVVAGGAAASSMWSHRAGRVKARFGLSGVGGRLHLGTLMLRRTS